MNMNLTEGRIVSKLFVFTIPLILGNILQQCYNIVDTWIVGRYIGSDALAAVGASFALIVFLNSIFIGLCMGMGNLLSIYYGNSDEKNIKKCIALSFIFIFLVAIMINIASIIFLDEIINIFNVPREIFELVKQYLFIMLCGMPIVVLYNFIANILRSIGNSVTPLVALGISTVINILLDVIFITEFKMGVEGAAFATIISQVISAIILVLYLIFKMNWVLPNKKDFKYNKDLFKEIINMSVITGMQQSIMNFGILLVQGLVNSFGTVVMAAFAAGVKIDAFAYMPLQDFGNGFSTFISQNYGAKKIERIKIAIRKVTMIISVFSIIISIVVYLNAEKLIGIFVSEAENEVIRVGAQYLKFEGSFYIGIGILFMLYGFYRAIKLPYMSLILTIISLGTRVILAYWLSSISQISLIGIWISVPIGWALADIIGILYFYKNKKIWRENEIRE